MWKPEKDATSLSQTDSDRGEVDDDEDEEDGAHEGKDGKDDDNDDEDDKTAEG